MVSGGLLTSRLNEISISAYYIRSNRLEDHVIIYRSVDNIENNTVSLRNIISAIYSLEIIAIPKMIVIIIIIRIRRFVGKTLWRYFCFKPVSLLTSKTKTTARDFAN